MKIKKITIDPDPYEPFRLAQGYRVGELLFKGYRCAGLQKFAESSAGVGKAPTWQLDLESIQLLQGGLGREKGHGLELAKLGQKVKPATRRRWLCSDMRHERV